MGSLEGCGVTAVQINRKKAKGGLCPRKSCDRVYSSDRVLLCCTENRLEEQPQETSLEAPLPHCHGRGEGHLDEGGREGAVEIQRGGKIQDVLRRKTA